VAVAPNGKNVYAVGYTSNSIVTYDRDATGALTKQGAIKDSTDLNGAIGVAVAPDGKNVYAVAAFSDSIITWDRL